MLDCRSARWHAGVSCRPRRICRQHRAGRKRRANRGRGRSAGARPDLARSRRPWRRTAHARAGSGAGSRAPARRRSAPAHVRQAAHASWSAGRISIAATDAYVDRLARPEKIACGSALKFCLLAEGAADLYPRLGPTSEWDVAAGHAVLLAAGGDVRRPDGAPLRYGATNFAFPASSPSAIRRHARSRYQRSPHLGPVPLGRSDRVVGIRGESRPRLVAVEEIEPLPRQSARAPDFPPWPRRAQAPSDRGRRSAAYRPPGRPRTPRGCPHCGTARWRRRTAVPARRGRAAGAEVDEIGDRIEAIDGQPGVAVDDHPFGGAAPVTLEPRPRPARSANIPAIATETALERRDFRSCRAAVIFPACGADSEFPAGERYGRGVSNGLSGAVALSRWST